MQDVESYRPELTEGRILWVFLNGIVCIASRPWKGHHKIYKYYCILKGMKLQDLPKLAWERLNNNLKGMVVCIKTYGLSPNGRLVVTLTKRNKNINNWVINFAASCTLSCK